MPSPQICGTGAVRRTVAFVWTETRAPISRPVKNVGSVRFDFRMMRPSGAMTVAWICELARPITTVRVPAYSNRSGAGV
jgi:hypothetical protein